MVKWFKVLVLESNPFEFILRSTSYWNRFNLISSQSLDVFSTSRKILLKYQSGYED